MTGLLLGILLARTFAGWVAKAERAAGACTVFVVAAVMNMAFVPFMFRFMPRMEPRQSLSYGQTMRSLWTLLRTEPLLREAGMLGRCFGSFSCFWTTLAFLLHSHYGMGPGVAGTFGVVGAAGALVAPVGGHGWRTGAARGSW
jgi:nitrate/nitrite transporter NarK